MIVSIEFHVTNGFASFEIGIVLVLVEILLVI